MADEEPVDVVCGYGRYQQILLWLVLLPAHVSCAPQLYSQLLMFLTPDHWCLGDGGVAVRATRVRLCAPVAGNRTTCDRGPEYDRRFLHADETVVTQWDLVCSRRLLATAGLVLFGGGLLAGHLVCAVFSERRGRRLSLVVFLFAQCLFGMLAAVSPNLIAFICLRFLVAVGTAGTWSSLTKLVEDLVGGGQRARALLLARCALSVGFLLVALVALLVRDWSYLAATTSVPFVTFLFYWRILPESPKWLLAHGRFNKAAKLMLIIAHTNTKHIPRDYLTALQEDASSHQITCGERDTSNLLQQFVDLCGTKETNRRIFLLLGIGLVNGVASLAQVYLAVGLAGNAYLHMLLMSSADLSACLAPLMMLKHSGCRKIAILGCISGGVTCFAHFVTSRRGHPCISLCLLAMSKVSVGSSLAVVPLWLHEISPSSQQAVVAHLAQTAELAAFAVVPLLFQQEDPELTPVVLSVLLIGGGILLTFDMHHPGRSWCLRKLRSRVGSWSCNRNKGMVYRSNAWEFKSLQNPSPIPSLVKRQEGLQMCPNFHPLQGVDTIKVTVV